MLKTSWILCLPPEARQFAEAMFAIHTQLVSADKHQRFLRSLASRAEVPEPVEIYQDTREVAESFGFPLDATYFFLGKAFSRFEEHHKPNVGVAIQVTHLARTATGTVTPFDSGRLRHHPRKYYGMRLPIANDGLPQRTAYLMMNRLQVRDCVDYFAAHLTRYFDRPENYWKKPDQHIDGVPLAEDDWHDWTFEMQIDPPVDCSERETICFLDETQRGGHTSIRDEFDRLVQAGLLSGMQYRPTSNPRRDSEREVRRRVAEKTGR